MNKGDKKETYITAIILTSNMTDEIKYSIFDASNDFSDLANEIREYILKHNNNKEEISESNFGLIALNTIRFYLLSFIAYIRAFCELQGVVTEENFINNEPPRGKPTGYPAYRLNICSWMSSCLIF